MSLFRNGFHLSNTEAAFEYASALSFYTDAVIFHGIELSQILCVSPINEDTRL